MDFVLHILELLGFVFIVVLILITREGPGQDRTARGINGIICLWSVIKQKRRLHEFIRVMDDNWNEITLPEGTQFRVGSEGGGELCTVVRPYMFLTRDLMETAKFRKG
ncbi:hypothetical protein LCGC14_0481300 [marine sediment metagenome]|uniref:Uncharacterized protein n=1 Tax=marine sediment metagenome TaxID=412755 RepID=A0A0F9S937_9ZZZZ